MKTKQQQGEVQNSSQTPQHKYTENTLKKKKNTDEQGAAIPVTDPTSDPEMTYDEGAVGGLPLLNWSPMIG